MSSNNSSSSSSGIGLAGGVFLVFLTLKLTNVIDWSWWWITAPLWAPAAFFAAMFLVGGLVIGLKAVLSR